jgi:hypothetical protein
MFTFPCADRKTCSSTGSIESKVGEFKVFDFIIGFEEAKSYRKSYGAYLRLNQWEDLTVEVWI